MTSSWSRSRSAARISRSISFKSSASSATRRPRRFPRRRSFSRACCNIRAGRFRSSTCASGAAAPLREDTRTVILEFDGGKIGVIVDVVTEVMQVAAEAVTPPPGIVKGLAAEYIAGLVVQNGRTIVVLNTNKLLNSKEKLALQGVA